MRMNGIDNTSTDSNSVIFYFVYDFLCMCDDDDEIQDRAT